MAPCSVVGHVFRQRNPSPFPGANINSIFRQNLGRLAAVWMDGFASIYFRDSGSSATYNRLNRPDVASDAKLAARAELRQQLQCKSFQWYLDTVYPSLFAPRADFVHYHGALYQVVESAGGGGGGGPETDAAARMCLQSPSEDPPIQSPLVFKVSAE